MRIFHFINSLDTGGSEHQMVEVVRRLSGKHSVQVGCLAAKGGYYDTLRELEIPVHEFNPHGSFASRQGITQLLGLVRHLRREKIQVFHSHDLYSNLMGVPAAWLARVPTIISSRRDLGSWWWYTPRNRRLLRYIQGLSNVVLANSEQVKRHLVEHDRFEEKSIVVAHNGVDCEPFEKAVRDRTMIPGATADDMLAIQVANMHVHTKGHTFLIDAAAEVCPRFDRLKFVLVGDGELRKEFEDKVAALGLASRFVFLGARDDVSNLLACCDIGMLVSLAEGLPNSVLEYSAAGLPVVATGVGGIPEIIEDGVTGYIVPPKDAGAIVTAISKLLTDREQAAKMGRKGRSRVRQEFSYARLIGQLEEIYSRATRN
jgi:glycosyltransferase involved in cell wall biosynthesis